MVAAVLCLALITGAGKASAATTVRVGYIPVLGSSALFVIDGKGWAKDAGLDLQLVRFTSGPQAIQALVAGRIDAYVAGVLPLLQVRAHGVDVKVLATGAIEELSVVAHGPLAAGLDATKPGGLTREALTERLSHFTTVTSRKPKIAAQPQGSVPDTVLRYWLKEEAGVASDAVDIVGIDIDAAQQAFLAGAVDAAILREPALTIIRARVPDARILATGHDLIPDQPGSVFAVLHPDAPDRAVWKGKLTALFVKATDLIASHPEEAAPYVASALGGGLMKPALIEGALKASARDFVADPGRITASVKTLQDFEVSQGLLRNAAPVEGLFDLETWHQATP
ncbi:ABC transporter substrate-binding protein [Acetobacter sp. LMG 1636]|uniref:ABC transporter substrate-binding protein n=2 Tax=Acetobacter fallax TaxID=1737473 RepID=A0ABX0KDS8_9PROT|nr:ABC transporter substrate-binding protein [Acetobacter fallax]NHO33273.1 ABC transporter substrate-binding protein [Acetobacter fallax]NHO36893.1 ABC transporter substrate-binding protein [Acetobacter fallax]